MQQFSVVLRELRQWFQSFAWYSYIQAFELKLLFGGIGVMFLQRILYQIMPIGSYSTLHMFFFTIPLFWIAKYAFWVGAWSTLVSQNIKYLPYGLWGYALFLLFPFDSFLLEILVSAAIYAFLGYAIFKFTASSYVELGSSNSRI